MENKIIVDVGNYRSFNDRPEFQNNDKCDIYDNEIDITIINDNAIDLYLKTIRKKLQSEQDNKITIVKVVINNNY
jgi:hypothetical protein